LGVSPSLAFQNSFSVAINEIDQTGPNQSMKPKAALHVYEVRPRKDHRGVDLVSDVLPFGRLWYDKPGHAIGYAMHFSRSADAVVRVYDAAGNVIETHENSGDFKECS